MKIPFTLVFPNLDYAEYMGFEKTTYESIKNDDDGSYFVLSENVIWFDVHTDITHLADQKVTFLTNSEYSTSCRKVFISGNKMWEKASEMALSISKDFHSVFKTVEYDDYYERFTVDVRKHIKSFTFLNTLNIALGFGQRRYVMDKDSAFHLRADFPPSLNSGISHLYIYASICKPIQVGGVRVPLLKSIWLDGSRRNFKHGELCNIVMKNPMYIPLCTTTINTVEIHIRSDSGDYIPFIAGSITSLTLHFKKTHSHLPSS